MTWSMSQLGHTDRHLSTHGLRLSAVPRGWEMFLFLLGNSLLGVGLALKNQQDPEVGRVTSASRA